MLLTQLRHLIPLPRMLRDLAWDRRAVTSVEYVIIAIIITLAIFGGLSRIGGFLAGTFNQAGSEL